MNEGNNLVNDPRCPNQAKDFAHGFQVLRTLPCDIFLGAHGGYFDLKMNYPRRRLAKANPFIDLADYKAFIVERQQTFCTELAWQLARR